RPDPFLALVHAWHVPPHTVLQQTPSVQNPLTHSALVVHDRPFAFWPTQTPPLQNEPVTHCDDVVQEVGQALLVPLHRYGLQLGLPGFPDGSVVQVPLALAPRAAAQASHPPKHAALQQNPSAQKPPEHSLFALHVWPMAF